MTYLLTVWLVWANPTVGAVLVQYEAETCSTALGEVLAEVIADGVTQYHVVSCQLTSMRV